MNKPKLEIERFDQIIRFPNDSAVVGVVKLPDTKVKWRNGIISYPRGFVFEIGNWKWLRETLSEMFSQ